VDEIVSIEATVSCIAATRNMALRYVSGKARGTVSRLNARRGSTGYYSYRRIFDLQLTGWARSSIRMPFSRVFAHASSLSSYRPPFRLSLKLTIGNIVLLCHATISLNIITSMVEIMR